MKKIQDEAREERKASGKNEDISPALSPHSPKKK